MSHDKMKLGPIETTAESTKALLEQFPYFENAF